MVHPVAPSLAHGDSIVKRLLCTVCSMRWMSLLLVFLGALMVNQFFSQLGHGRFSADGFESYTRFLASTGNVNRVAQSALNAVADHADVFGPLLAIFVTITGVALMLLVARPIAAFCVSLFFWVLWYVTSTTSGIWAFEYLFPAVFSLIAGLATLPQFAGASGRDRWLGARVRGRLRLPAWIALSIGVSALLTWFFIMARGGGGQPDYEAVAAYSGAAIVLLLITTGLIDHHRHADPPTPEGRYRRLAALPWIDMMIIVIGAMVCIQVFADIQVDWFTVDGYQHLTRLYAQTTGAPEWWSDFLWLASENAAVLMPIQATLEFSCAFFLVTLLVRPLTLLATFVFFSTLMISEFGTPVGHIANDDTWEWELLFVTGTILVLAVVTLAEALGKEGWRARILGDRFYPIGLPWKFLVAIVGAGLLWAVGIQTKMFGSGYETISWRGGLFFFCALVALAIIDRWRRPVSVEERITRVWLT